MHDAAAGYGMWGPVTTHWAKTSLRTWYNSGTMHVEAVGRSHPGRRNLPLCAPVLARHGPKCVQARSSRKPGRRPSRLPESSDAIPPLEPWA